MLKQERIKLIDEYIAERGFVSMEELCNKFSVSINTIRADLKTIIDMGHAEKTYGGAAAVPAGGAELTPNESRSASYGDYDVRLVLQSAQKERIAKAAAALVQDNDIIYLDSGTTCLPMLDYIPESYSISVITNDLNILNKAARRERVRLLTLGGLYNQKSNSFQCDSAMLRNYVEEYNISKAFLGTTGISPAGLLTNSENFCREIRVLLLQKCPQCYVLADASKFTKVGLMSYGSLSDVTACICDDTLPEKCRKLCRDVGANLVLV